MTRKIVPVEFKWRHYEPEMILCCVRWYLRYMLSYRDLAEMMQERGLSIVHTTIYRWIQHYAPELEKRVKYFLKHPGGSWRVDETYIKIKGKWHYLYRSVDQSGNTIDFYLSKTRNQKAAKRFLGKALHAKRNETPHSITIDKNPAYPPAIAELKQEGKLPKDVTIRQCKYLNNIVEQDHRRVKRKLRQVMGYFSYKTAYNTIRGIETLHMIFKGQLWHLFDRSPRSYKYFIHRQFHLFDPEFCLIK